MTAGSEFSMDEVRPIELDPDVYRTSRDARAYRLNVVTDPILRVIGFGVAALAIWLHNQTLLPAGLAPPFLPVAAIFTLYPLVSWLLLYVLYRRWPSLPFLLLFSDIAQRLRVEEGVAIAPEPIYNEFYLVEAEV